MSQSTRKDEDETPNALSLILQAVLNLFPTVWW